MSTVGVTSVSNTVLFTDFIYYRIGGLSVSPGSGKIEKVPTLILGFVLVFFFFFITFPKCVCGYIWIGVASTAPLVVG